MIGPAIPLHLLTQSVQIVNVTAGVETSGSPTQAWSYPAETFPAFVQPSTSQESMAYMRDGSEEIVRVYISPNGSSGTAATTFKQAARIKVDGDKVYEVVNSPRDLCTAGTVVSLIARRLQ